MSCSHCKKSSKITKAITNGVLSNTKLPYFSRKRFLKHLNGSYLTPQRIQGCKFINKYKDFNNGPITKAITRLRYAALTLFSYRETVLCSLYLTFIITITELRFLLRKGFLWSLVFFALFSRTASKLCNNAMRS